MPRPSPRTLAVLAVGALAATLAAQGWSFEPVQPDDLAAGGSLVNAWADFDGDGDPDLFVGFNGAPNRLYRNDKSVLIDVAGPAGVADARGTRAAAWGDYDHDGDPDLLVGFAPGDAPVLKLYRNDSGVFVDVGKEAGLEVSGGAVRQVSWIDLDADGDLDLYVAFRDRPNMLFVNDKGRFADRAAELGLNDGRRSVGAVWFDADADGDLDLYQANMDGDANGFFRNDEGRFIDVAEAAGLRWGGRAPFDAANGTVRPCAADVNGDGRFDLFTANYGPNGLFLNRGNGTFTDVSASWGVARDGRYDSCVFGDVDADGHVDVYVNGTVTGGVSYPDSLLRNSGTAFVDATPASVRALEADHGAAWLDFDGDGDLDLSLTGSQPAGMHFVLRNLLPRAAARKSLQVRVVTAQGSGMPGAEVRAYVAGTRQLVAAGLVDSGSGYNAQNDVPVFLGLGSADWIDVEVTLPVRGRPVTRLAGVRPDDNAGRALIVRVR